ncbi:MAG: hypothetical protein WAX57_01635, partial [Minisyncoccia bacterium]
MLTRIKNGWQLLATMLGIALLISIVLFGAPFLAHAQSGASSVGGGWFDYYVWQPLTNSLGTLFLTIGGGLLLFAGSVFDEFVKYLIVDLQTTITTTAPILDGLKVGWQLFR